MITLSFMLTASMPISKLHIPPRAYKLATYDVQVDDSGSGNVAFHTLTLAVTVLSALQTANYYFPIIVKTARRSSLFIKFILFSIAFEIL